MIERVKITYRLTNEEVRKLKKNYKLTHLAKKLGMSKSYLCDIYKRRRPVSAKYVGKIRKILSRL